MEVDKISERTDVAEERAKRLGRGFGALGRMVWKGVQGANRGLDKIGFPKVDPRSMMSGKPQRIPIAPKVIHPVQSVQPQVHPQQEKEVAYCPICGWVYLPHHHKVVER